MLQISERVRIVQGDIVKQNVDAIVNAANSTLLGGGGVDGAIHRAAGSGLLEECRNLNGCETGEAKVTKGYLLPANWVIHTVGPIWRGGKEKEDDLLASCYRKSLELAREYSVKTIAFPAISTGAYHFPPARAAEVAVREIKRFLEENELPETIILVCFNGEVCKHLQNAVKNILRE